MVVWLLFVDVIRVLGCLLRFVVWFFSSFVLIVLELLVFRIRMIFFVGMVCSMVVNVDVEI